MAKAKLKPIETVFLGYRFRSRLEARWAVFFDKLAVPYEYEREGYDLGPAGWYLPDFWLPTWDSWIEIKPEIPGKEEQQKLVALAKQSEKRCLLLYGTPWPAEHAIASTTRIELGDSDYEIAIDWNPPYNQFGQCRRCDGLCLVFVEDWMWAWADVGPHSCRDHDKYPLIAESGYAPRIEAAYVAARQARFEHQ